MIGQIDVLSVGGGHDELKFECPKEAKEQIEKLLHSSHSVLIEHEGATYKVSGFDDTTSEYLVKTTEETVEEKRFPIGETRVTTIDTPEGVKHVARVDEDKKEYIVEDRKTTTVTKKFPMAAVKATAVAPTAGG